MVRLACISLPKVDLQVIGLRHPEWKELPAAVVTEEKPLGTITAANRLAYASGVRPGMRYAAALSICPQLRAGVVEAQERDALRDHLLETLRDFSPEIEPARDDPALFWINASGLERLYGDAGQWASAIETAIEAIGLVCSIAVGFTRFGTYAAAKVKRRITRFESEADERAAADEAPIGVLPFDHDTLARLQQLGILTVSDFCRFSPGSLRRRFGPEVESLQRFAKGEASLPVQPASERPVLRREMRLLYPQVSTETLVRHQLSLLRELVAQAWSRQQLVSELTMEFCPESWPGRDEECHTEQILTSRPTLDQRRLERLVRLRLENTRLSQPIVRLSLEVVLLPTERVQDDLFAARPRRDPAKALAALADLRAELGNDAVQLASLEDAHLPEDQYRWRRIDSLAPPRPAAETASTLVRRVLHEALPLSQLPDEFLRSGEGASGPYELSGGWWQTPYRREYYYLTDRGGRTLWVYFDAPQKRWYVQGIVE